MAPTQPKALRIAELPNSHAKNGTCTNCDEEREAATELLRLHAENKALRASHGQASSQAGWQPIETAPANGQCLVWCDTDDGGEVMKLCRDEKGNWLYEGEPTYATSFYIEPTHWRELPPPPSSAQREVGNANS